VINDFKGSMKIKKKTKKAQITLFIIISILLVTVVIIYYTLRKPYEEKLPKDFQPIYDHYVGCLEETTRQGTVLLGEQGGYIEVPEFVQGSQYMPFSSQLDFLGQPVPYWMYVSGNNLLREQVPTKNSMENQLEQYILKRLDFCDFTDFIEKGYSINIEAGESLVVINEKDVDVEIDNLVKFYFDNSSVVVDNHKFNINSKLGKFYDLALKTYNYEKENMFLEKYAIDVLRLYAPVTGVELSCSPKVFIEEDIKQDLVEGLVGNVGALKLKGNYYGLSNNENKYFVTDIGKNIDENVNFIYSTSFPMRIEIYGDTIAEPVGLQQGLGMMGFCYVPYHLIYDINFPVLVQFYDGKEIFQFPVAVILDKNQARDVLPSLAGESIESEVCKYKEQLVDINTYNMDLEPVEARIKFKCLEDSCNIGETEISGDDAFLEGYFPKCVNGFIIASAEGYADAKYMISTNRESHADILMNKLYHIDIGFESDVESALVSFDSEDYSTTVYYPDFNGVEIIEGHYNLTLYVYDNSTLKMPETSTKQCVNVPKSGIAGFIGMEEERCFDITIPEQELHRVVVGGGKTSDYFTENQLKDAGKILISYELFSKPTNLDEVQNNYMEVDSAHIDILVE